ncbi:Pimeloyl-ACP methyl ester carboxylesterase [Dyella sp. OK004]|uniref:alpha/beta fold hydrolase n=1 Tax=Dyella sp. OK004 TaxID=1855292 RepID=UPI0008F33819|nr:alpha/beta hydrolase [Dyella sp. OK004]SFS02761.1 Pimeloyl-ACP methyl ester carboxylesterase [Dyella sp. OK004]
MSRTSTRRKELTAPHARWVEVNGAHLHTELAGQGEAITMLHGFLVDSGQWDGEFADFAQTHRVLRYDLRGFGRSSMPEAPFSHHQDLAAVLDASGIERTALLACSGGAATALDFALEHPQRVTSLVLVGPGYWGRFANRTPEARAFVAAIQSGDAEAMLEPSLRAFVDGPRRSPEQSNAVARERIRAMSAWNFGREDGYWRHAQWQRDPQPSALERLGELSMPVLVIVGEEDQAEVIELSQQLVEGLPNARLALIPDAGHQTNMEAPDVVMPLLRDVFARPVARGVV